MLRTMKTALLAASLVAAATVNAAAQDQESGEVELPPPAVEASPAESRREARKSRKERKEAKAEAREVKQEKREEKQEKREEAKEEAREEAETDDVVADEPVAASRSRSVGTPGPLRAYGGFNVAIGGKRAYSTALDIEGKLPLDPTVGFQGGADYIVMDYFSIGGEMRLLWTKVDGFGDRDFLWDLAVNPRGRYAFGNMPLEVYGAVPVGLTAAGIKGRPEGKVGFNVGLRVGANWFFNENMAVNAEMGWQFHKYGIEIANELGKVEGDIKQNQFVLLCPNFVYAF